MPVFFLPKPLLTMVSQLPDAQEKVSDHIDLDEVRALVEPLVEAHGLVLHDVVWTTSPAGPILRVTIEHELPADLELVSSVGVPLQVQGVSMENCVAVSRDINTTLDAIDLIDRAFSLEVSSPGLDRPLKTERDFQRQLGRLAKLKLKAPAPDGQMVLRGTLRAFIDGCVTLLVDGNEHTVALDNIQSAKLVFELGGKKQTSQKRSKHPSKGTTASRNRRRTGS